MKGLDNYIMGLNDPNAPFNQTLFEDEFAPVFDLCDWITEEMLEDDTVFPVLGSIFEEEVSKILEPDRYYTAKERYALLKENASVLEQRIKRKFMAKKLVYEDYADGEILNLLTQAGFFEDKDVSNAAKAAPVTLNVIRRWLSVKSDIDISSYPVLKKGKKRFYCIIHKSSTHFTTFKKSYDTETEAVSVAIKFVLKKTKNNN
jgi:hypothetical protein